MLPSLRSPALLMSALLASLFALSVGCGGSTDSETSDDDCPVSVYVYDRDGNEQSNTCAPMPAQCGSEPSCGDGCAPALDLLCPEGTSPSACSVVTMGATAETTVACTVLP